MKKTDTQSRLQQNKENYTKESNEANKNTLKEEILQIINDDFIEIRDDIRHGQPKCTGNTQEILRQQKKNMRKHKNK
jgi:hypothetical protein